MTSPVTDLLNGFSQILNDAGLGLTWRSDGTSYLDDEIPIVKVSDRAAIVGAQVVLNWINLTDDPTIPQGTGYLQAAVIGAPNDANSPTDLSYWIGATLHGLTAQQFGQAQLVSCLRSSSVPMPPDVLDRSSVANQFLCNVEWPPTDYRPL